MPGLSFLFKKAWHPARLDNQKNVFIQENTARSRQEREAEAAKEVAKEEEIRMYERAGDVSERDPRASSLKFMYAQPKATGDSSSSRPAPAPPPTAGTGDDDEDVKRFWSRLTGHEEDTPMAPAPAGSAVSSHTAVPKNLVRQPTTLEKQLGIRPGEFLNKAQMEERHPRLKNAPVDGGAYTANIAMSHKPFNDLVRNVRCVRCGEWGHVRGDRECSLLHEVSAADLARQRQEDPLNSMHSDIYIKEKQKLVLRKAIAGKRPTNGISADKASLPVTEQLIESDEEGEELG